MKKLNCWQIKHCGKEPGGEKAAASGTCPAATEPFFDGINNGVNAGRYCWRIENTECRREVMLAPRANATACSQCEVLIQVIREEGSSFRL